MQNLYDDLAKILEKDERIFADGKIIKNKVSELAFKLDKDLLDLLLKNKQMKEHFFVKAENDILVFDQDKFIKFVNNKEFLPDSFTTFKNRIGLTENDDYIKDNGKIVLSWGYKDCVLEGGQEDIKEKRDEIFYNEILAPDEVDRLKDCKVFTNWKKYDEKGEHDLKDLSSDNLIIKGNNLLSLCSLLHKYKGQIKLIYIDPPYYFKDDKSEDSFLYNSNFKLSTWLVFMRNRLESAKELLSKEGIIYIQINEDSHSYLKVLLDELFYPENFLNTITVKVKNMAGVAGGGEEVSLRDLSEKLLVYAKDIESFKGFKNIEYWEEVEKQELLDLKVIHKLGSIKSSKIINDKKINIRKDVEIKSLSEIINAEKIKIEDALKKYSGRIYKETFKNQSSIRQLVIDNSKPDDELVEVVYAPQTGQFKGKEISVYYSGKIKRFVGAIDHKIKLENKKYYYRKSFGNIWDDISWNGIGNEGGVNLNNGKKPEKLIQRIIDMTTEVGDIILDYHLGSGTTCAVAHKMGRKYIGMEQLDYGNNDSIIRLKNVIKGDQTGISKSVGWKKGGSFIYAELKEWNEEYVQKIREAKTPKELVDIYKKMQKEAFFRYDIDLSKFDEKDFSKLESKDQKQVLMECLDKNHLYVNYSEIDDSTYKVSAEDKKINKQFYGK